MKIYSKFNKIFSMLINNKFKEKQIIKYLQKYYNQIVNEEILLCLIKIIIILIYKNIKNIDNIINILNYLTNNTNSKFKIKMINYISNLNMSKQFNLSEEFIEKLCINSHSLFIKDTQLDLNIQIWFNILISVNKLKINSLELKCSIYNELIKDKNIINSKNYKIELNNFINNVNMYLDL